MELTDLSNYILPNVDIKAGDLLLIKDEGERKTLQNGNVVYTFGVETPSKEARKLTMNKTSRTELAIAWGKDTKNWVGKQAKVDEIRPQKIGGKDKLVIYLKPSNEDAVID